MNFAGVAAVAMKNNRRLRAGEHRRGIDDDSELILSRGHHDDERSPPAAAAAATGPSSLKYYLQGSVLISGSDVLILQKAMAGKSGLGCGGDTPAGVAAAST